jgi:hypothetical protein
MRTPKRLLPKRLNQKMLKKTKTMKKATTAFHKRRKKKQQQLLPLPLILMPLPSKSAGKKNLLMSKIWLVLN